MTAQSPFSDAVPGAGPIARARAARERAPACLARTIADFLLGEASRLDERARLVLARVLSDVLGAIASDLRRDAARRLAGRHATEAAETLLAVEADVVGRLSRSRLFADDELVGELLARVREDELTDALPPVVADIDRPSLLVRLTDAPDTTVAAAARDLLVAQARRRDVGGEAGVGVSLPGDLHYRLVWAVVAVLREALVLETADTDRALAEAALRNIAAHDEGDAVEAVAARLALVIDARPVELVPLLVEALGDRQLPLFIAVLGHALGIDYAAMRDVVLEREGDQLWLALHAAGVERTVIAQLGLALADADPRREVEALADTLDELMTVSVEAARESLAPLALHRDFRAAIDILARERQL